MRHITAIDSRGVSKCNSVPLQQETKSLSHTSRMPPQPSAIIHVLEMSNRERKPRAIRIGRLPTLLACSFGFALLPTVHSFTVPVARLHRSTRSSSLHAMPPDAIHSVSQVAASLSGMLPQNIPFSDLGKQLSDSLDIGSSLSREVSSIPEVTTDIVLESLGYDVLVFLAASVVVTPLSKLLNITPILGYLILGAILGPHGLDLFSNSKADVELGDFGILFLLFSEGLEVTSERLKKLVNFLPLGFAQISLVTAAISKFPFRKSSRCSQVLLFDRYTSFVVCSFYLSFDQRRPL